MKISDIEKELATGQIPPHRLAEIRAELSSYYSYISGVLEEILATKAVRWLEMRKEEKSDKATDKQWDATEEGIKEMKCRLRLKRTEKMIGGVKSLLEVAEGQARNQY